MNKILLYPIIMCSSLYSLAPSDTLLTALKNCAYSYLEAKKLILQAPIQDLDTSCLECIPVKNRCALLKSVGNNNLTMNNLGFQLDKESITRCRALLERFGKESSEKESRDTWESLNNFMGQDIIAFFYNPTLPTLHPYNILPVEFLAEKINSKKEKEQGTEAWLLIDFCMHVDDERLNDPILKPLINVHLENTREKLTEHLCSIFYDYSFDTNQATTLEQLKAGFRIFNLFAHIMTSDGGQTWEDYLESLIRGKIKDNKLTKQKANNILRYCYSHISKSMVNLIQRISSEATDPIFQ